MTINVQVKRAMGSLLILIFLAGCSLWNAWFGREEINLGEYVTVEAENVEEGQPVRWVFSQLPDSSKLLGFLPSDTVLQISFKPDVVGEYSVVLQQGPAEDMSEESFFFKAIVQEDNTLVNTDVPEHLIQALINEDTTIAEPPVIQNYTPDGDQRSYLSKVIPPSQKKKVSAAKKKRPAPVTPTPSNRGSLIPQADKTYTIQLSSWPSLDDAHEAARELLDTFGIDSYVQRAFFKDKDEVYYRLRVGNFPNFSDAEAYAKEIQGITSLPAWVDFVRQEM